MGNLQSFSSSSDFVFAAIPLMYPTGYTTVVNCWFSAWSQDEGDGRKPAFDRWLENRRDRLPEDHPFLDEAVFLQFGSCIIFNSQDEAEAWQVYKFFDDPDYYYVTFWEHGEITNENT